MVAVAAHGHAVAGAEFAWASDDTLVAMVDSGGLVTGQRARVGLRLRRRTTATANGRALPFT